MWQTRWSQRVGLVIHEMHLYCLNSNFVYVGSDRLLDLGSAEFVSNFLPPILHWKSCMVFARSKWEQAWICWGWRPTSEVKELITVACEMNWFDHRGDGAVIVCMDGSTSKISMNWGTTISIVEVMSSSHLEDGDRSGRSLVWRQTLKGVYRFLLRLTLACGSMVPTFDKAPCLSAPQQGGSKRK